MNTARTAEGIPCCPRLFWLARKPALFWKETGLPLPLIKNVERTICKFWFAVRE